MINKYKMRSRISEARIRQIIKLFALDIEATKTAELTGISRKSINKIPRRIRERIATVCSKVLLMKVKLKSMKATLVLVGSEVSEAVVPKVNTSSLV